MLTNPALDLYALWRQVIRFHSERSLHGLRAKIPDTLDVDEVESWSRTYSNGRSIVAPLDYRMRLTISGLTACHLRRKPTSPDEYEPIITLSAQQSSRMTLWPNGDFYLNALPRWHYKDFPTWTFLKTNYVAGRRVWLMPEERMESRNWVDVDEKDYTVRRPYLPNDAFSTVRYRLKKDDRGFWRIATCDTGKTHHPGASDIEDGYAACERRYARHEARQSAVVRRRQLAVHVTKQGRMTGNDAIHEVSKHLRVYPAPKPEEALVEDHLVASAVH